MFPKQCPFTEHIHPNLVKPETLATISQCLLWLEVAAMAKTRKSAQFVAKKGRKRKHIFEQKNK